MSEKKDKKTESAGKDQPEMPKAEIMVTSQPNLKALPLHVQQALSKYKVEEKIGIAPTWQPDVEGAYIVGRVVKASKQGQYGTWVMTMLTPEGPLSVWLTADLVMKLNPEEDGLQGRNLVVIFDGWLRKSENPKLKNDMKLFTAHEISEKDEKDEGLLPGK